jgi:uncharacterized SAM-binding protein YcdF (DUF218 family)
LTLLSARVHAFSRHLEASPRGEALVVLGARLLANGRPSPAFLGRIERAAELYAQGAASLVVFSGGGQPSEARAALTHALTLGVPEAACLREELSTNTVENARHSAALLLPRGVKTVVVVSDGFHLLRAVRCFRAFGLHPVPAASRRQLARRTLWVATLKEAVAYLRAPPGPG